FFLVAGAAPFAAAGTLAASAAGAFATAAPVSPAVSDGGAGGVGGGLFASATFFKLARPSSKSLPIIPSIGLITENALLMKLCFPSIAHVTFVVVGLSAASVNVMPACDWNGSRNSSFSATFSPGRASVIVILPLPTSLFPS